MMKKSFEKCSALFLAIADRVGCWIGARGLVMRV